MHVFYKVDNAQFSVVSFKILEEGAHISLFLWRYVKY